MPGPPKGDLYKSFLTGDISGSVRAVIVLGINESLLIGSQLMMQLINIRKSSRFANCPIDLAKISLI
jgi:hypothetical protein